MNSVAVINIIRFIILVLAQVLILKRISFSFGEFAFIHFIIYPLFILLLPFNVPRPVQMFFGFVLGLTVDIFYDSPGIHASACVFTAYIRPYILSLLEPYEGYGTTACPTISSLGFPWFLTYSSIAMGLHLLFYFSVEAFSFVFLFEILMNSIFSLIASLLLVILVMLIFNPKH